MFSVIFILHRLWSIFVLKLKNYLSNGDVSVLKSAPKNAPGNSGHAGTSWWESAVMRPRAYIYVIIYADCGHIMCRLRSHCADCGHSVCRLRSLKLSGAGDKLVDGDFEGDFGLDSGVQVALAFVALRDPAIGVEDGLIVFPTTAEFVQTVLGRRLI